MVHLWNPLDLGPFLRPTRATLNATPDHFRFNDVALLKSDIGKLVNAFKDYTQSTHGRLFKDPILSSNLLDATSPLDLDVPVLPIAIQD